MGGLVVGRIGFRYRVRVGYCKVGQKFVFIRIRLLLRCVVSSQSSQSLVQDFGNNCVRRDRVGWQSYMRVLICVLGFILRVVGRVQVLRARLCSQVVAGVDVIQDGLEFFQVGWLAVCLRRGCQVRNLRVVVVLGGCGVQYS